MRNGPSVQRPEMAQEPYRPPMAPPNYYHQYNFEVPTPPEARVENPILPMHKLIASIQNPPMNREKFQKKIKTPVIDNSKTQTWHDYPMEKRYLKRNKLRAPDFYPQAVDQEEDKLTPDRIRKGFYPNIFSCEYEGASSKVIGTNFDAVDETHAKAATYISSIQSKKPDSAVINFDRKKLKDLGFVQPEQTIAKLPQSLIDITRKPYTSLCKRLPSFKSSDEAMEMLFTHRIDIPHALWYLKVGYVGQLCHSKMKKAVELSDMSQAFLKFLKELLNKLDVEHNCFRLKWKYFTTMIRHAVMDGCVERQDFLMDLADILFEMHQKCTLGKMRLYRLIVNFVSMFTREIVQNVFVSRKFFYVLGLRLQGYLDEAEKRQKVRISPKQVFTELLNCQSHRSIIMTTFGIVSAIVIDCPAACVWSPLDITHVPACLVGSPLDSFPIDPLVIPSFLDESTDFGRDFKKIMAARLQEIHRRSYYVDNRWSLNSKQQTGFQAMVHACIDVVSLLDTAELNNQRGIYSLYAKMFGLTRESEIFKDETLVRIRAMLQWAVTHEREGTYRALLVTNLLQLHVRHFRTNFFNDRPIGQVIVDFLDREGPKLGTSGYRRQYTNLVLLLVEMQRGGLFPHNEYVQMLIRYDKLQALTDPPIIVKAQKKLDEDAPEKNASSSTPVFERPSTSAAEPGSVNTPAVQPFIPTISETPVEKFKEKGVDIEWVEMKNEDLDERPFLEKPDNLTVHERLLIQLPIEQIEANRGAINQRNIYLYGITEERTAAQLALRKFASDVSKNFLKHSIRFHTLVKEIRRRSYMDTLNKQIIEFKGFTFYDQQVIAGICADEYLKFITSFGKNGVNVLPDMECLDMLVIMFESAQCLGSLLTFFLELIPVVSDCEAVLDSFRSDYTPGSFSSQQGFVMVGLLADHYKYFLLSPIAGKLVNGLYRLIEKKVKFIGYPISGWARTVAAFLLQARFDLRHRFPTTFAFRARDVRKLLPSAGTILDCPPERYNAKLFSDLLGLPRRCLSYHELKLRLPSIDTLEAAHSFAVNAFAVALTFESDFEKLSELANFCGTISAMKSLETAWLNVIIALCSPINGSREQPGLDAIKDFDDYSKHYAFCTFVTLLASKFCFSAYTLFLRLNNEVILPCLNNLLTEYTQNMLKRFPLVFQVITNIITATDEPILLSKRLFHPHEAPKRILTRSADLRCLRILHVRELDVIILPILANVFFYVESIKKRDEYHDVYNFGWNCVLTISDEEWVIQRMFQICNNDRDVDDFNNGQFGRDSLGQYLIRIALRRRSEREIKVYLVSNKGTKRSFIDKLFSVLTVWNLRAAYCNIRVMIKAVNGKGVKYPAQSAIQTESLFKEISRSCRDFFIKDPSEKVVIRAPNVDEIRFTDLTCYWLLSELIDTITPDNNVSKTLKSIFLDDVSTMFASMAGDDKDRVRKLKVSATLLSMQPFVNLLLICQNGEEKARDNLIHSLLIHAREMMKQKEDPELRRECLLLRINLVGSLLEFSSPSTEITWITLFGMLLNGVITPERDGEYFVHCFDMLMMCVLGLYSGSALPTVNANGEIVKPRYHEYAAFVRAARKEIGDRPLPDNLKSLEQLLPISRGRTELAAFGDWFSSTSPQKPSSVSKLPVSGANFARNVKSIRMDKLAEPAQKRLQRFLYHSHQWEYFHPGIPGQPLNKNQLESHVVGPQEYAEASKTAPQPQPQPPSVAPPSVSQPQSTQMTPRFSPMPPGPSSNGYFRPPHPQGVPPGFPPQQQDQQQPPPNAMNAAAQHFFSSGPERKNMMGPSHSQASGFNNSSMNTQPPAFNSSGSGAFGNNTIPNVPGPMNPNFQGGPPGQPSFNMIPPGGHPGMRAPGVMSSTRAQTNAAIRRKIPGGGGSVVAPSQTPPSGPKAKRTKHDSNDMPPPLSANQNFYGSQGPPPPGQWPPPGPPGGSGFPPRMLGAAPYGPGIPNQPPPQQQVQQQQHQPSQSQIPAPHNPEVKENLRQKLQIRRQSKQASQMPPVPASLTGNTVGGSSGGPSGSGAGPSNAAIIEQQQRQQMMFFAQQQQQQHQHRMMMQQQQMQQTNGIPRPNFAMQPPMGMNQQQMPPGAFNRQQPP